MPIVEQPPGSSGGGSGTVTSVSSADTSIAVSTPTTTPALKLATLDVIATNEPAAAAVPFNGQKITGLASGTLATDAAAFGQIPTALPPNGTAGGDLSGTYPNPKVAKVTETSGPTDLTIGTIADGQFLKRSGATLVSGAPVASVAATDTSIVVAGTVTAPTIATGTLDAIAADHPAAADWSNNSHKISSVADPTNAQDAATRNYVDTHLEAVGLLPTGAIAQSVPRFSAFANSVSLTSGTLRLNGIYLPKNMLVTSISFVSGTQALVSGTHQIFGIYNAALSRLAQTNDDTSTAWAASTVKTLTLTASYTVTSDGLYYIAVLVSANTPPSVQISAGAATITVQLIAPAIVGNTSDVGITSLPLTAGSAPTGGTIPYFYLS